MALTIPVVTVCSSPNGLPMAITGSPTASRSESPKGRVGSPEACTPEQGDVGPGVAATSRASSSPWSARRATICAAPRTTWKFVTMKPSVEAMKPEPRL